MVVQGSLVVVQGSLVVVQGSLVTHPTICIEKAKLAERYRVATVTFAEAVRELQHHLGKSDIAEDPRVDSILNYAKRLCEEARLSLEAHLTEHGC